MDSLTIRIWQTEQGDGGNGGYMYDIYDTDEWTDDLESIDGGLCTGTMKNALEMATSQTNDIIDRQNDKTITPDEWQALADACDLVRQYIDMGLATDENGEQTKQAGERINREIYEPLSTLNEKLKREMN